MIFSLKKQQELENRTVTVIETFRGRLADIWIDEYVSLAQHLEWGVALENLCTQLYEFDLTPTEVELEQIKTLGGEVGVAERYWNIWLLRRI